MMATASSTPAIRQVENTLYRIPLDLYHQMGESGLLTPRDRVVLLDGLLVKKMTKGPRHSTANRRGMKALEAVIPAAWHVRIEQPISLVGGPDGADSEPEPDLVVVRGGDDRYLDRHPGPRDVALIVEIADSSLRRDRVGLARYAWAGIPRVWIVNLIDRCVEDYSGASGPSESPGYSERIDHVTGGTLTITLDGSVHGPIAAGDFLP